MANVQTIVSITKHATMRMITRFCFCLFFFALVFESLAMMGGGLRHVQTS